MNKNLIKNDISGSGRIIRMNEVVAKVRLAPSTIYELQTSTPPKFPKSFKIVEGGRAAGWLESEIDAWVEQRSNERSAPTNLQKSPSTSNAQKDIAAESKFGQGITMQQFHTENESGANLGQHSGEAP